jgi:hypothetical protein
MQIKKKYTSSWLNGVPVNLYMKYHNPFPICEEEEFYLLGHNAV